MVMENGHLVSMDSHENLIVSNPMYRSLFNLVAEEEAYEASEASEGTSG